jgi:SAM-dependent methyltransferase
VSFGIRFLDQHFYSDFGPNWDVRLFREHVDLHLGAQTSVLDFGAGRGALPEMDLRGHARFVAAVDVDPAVLDNPRVDEAKIFLPNGEIPFPSGHFDVVIAHNVLEHLPDPASSFREIHRVLRPGGVFLSKTPNRLHYVPAIAHLTPHRFHVWVNRRRGRHEADTFETHYRCNTPRAIRSLAKESGFSVERIELVEGRPEYLRQNAALYTLGMLYERTVNNVPGLGAFRVVMVSTLRQV